MSELVSTSASRWYCCQCGDGPNNLVIVVSCLNCGRKRCQRCQVVAGKSYGPQRVPGWSPVTEIDKTQTSDLLMPSKVSKLDDSVTKQLRQAVVKGNENEVRELLSQYPNFLTRSTVAFDPPLLHIAARHSFAITSLLLEAGARVNSIEKSGETPLHCAILGSSTQKSEIVGLLLRHGANFDAVDNYLVSPLLAATKTQNSAVVTQLLRSGASIGRPSFGDPQPLLVAIQNSDEDIVQLLLDAGAESNWQSDTLPLVAAATTGNCAIIRSLIENGADVALADNDCGSLVISTALAGQHDAALLFLQHGADASKLCDLWDEWKLRDRATMDLPGPSYLVLWQLASQNARFRSLWELGSLLELYSPSYIESHSISWEWELPAMVRSVNPKDGLAKCGTSWKPLQHVVFISDEEPEEVVEILDSRSSSVPLQWFEEILSKIGPLSTLPKSTPKSHEPAGFVLATTCIDYLKEYFSAAIVEVILELLEIVAIAEIGPDSFGFSLWRLGNDPRSSLWITCSHSEITLNYGPLLDPGSYVDLIEAIDWLCRVLRPQPREDRLLLSVSAYEFRIVASAGDSGKAKTKRNLQELTWKPIIRLESYVSKAQQKSCWRPLLQSAIIAQIHPQVSRPTNSQDGMYLSFDLLIALTAVEYPLVVGEGALFAGYSTVLYPTKIEGAVAHFHLVTSEKGQINPFRLDLPGRMLTTDLHQFRKMQCILGWCDQAQITLGTGNLSFNVKYSGGRDIERSLQLKNLTLMFQLGASAPVSAILGIQPEYTFVSHRRQFTPQDNYHKLLQDTARELAVAYDAADRRSWLIPKLSLILHMCHSYVAKCVDVSPSAIPVVPNHTDADQIIQTLLTHSDTVILGSHGSFLLLRQLMLGLSMNLLTTRDALARSEGTKLHGFEYMDIVLEPGRGSCMKRLHLQASAKCWLDIVNEVDAVVVCSGLGEAITAMDGSRPCNTCNTVPMDQDYLAATIPCLKRLIERKGGDVFQAMDPPCNKISERSFWRICGRPFEPCTHGAGDAQNCWRRVDILQRLIKSRTWSWTARITSTVAAPVISIPPAGALVFGQK